MSVCSACVQAHEHMCMEGATGIIFNRDNLFKFWYPLNLLL